MAQLFGNKKTSVTPSKKEDLPQAEYWINIGMKADDGTLVMLPRGIPLDTMQPLDERGNSEEWVQTTKDSNALLSFIQKAVSEMDMEHGSVEEIEDLVITIRRTKVKATAEGYVPKTFSFAK